MMEVSLLHELQWKVQGLDVEENEVDINILEAIFVYWKLVDVDISTLMLS